jgi:hypothetical protein
LHTSVSPADSADFRRKTKNIIPIAGNFVFEQEQFFFFPHVSWSKAILGLLFRFGFKMAIIGRE